ncbi:MAG: four-helix bundle copper-binding protein [Actinobacteria bacterium]|nr:MAG: four-helix bundle copper-binding protein [Actinomycetota bacterium]
MTFQEIIKLHPQPTSLDRDLLLRCIGQCIDCAASCTSCADADLAENDVPELVRCIRLCLDCADVCDAAGRVLIRQTAPDLRVLRTTIEACVAACRVSGDECERHASHHEHCRLCGEVCRRCEQACDDLLGTIS